MIGTTPSGAAGASSPEPTEAPSAAPSLGSRGRYREAASTTAQEHRKAMRIQDKSLIRITPTRWGPIATGRFPADVAARLDG